MGLLERKNDKEKDNKKEKTAFFFHVDSLGKMWGGVRKEPG